MESERTKNREATEKRLLEAVDALVCDEGFESLGVNAAANRAGVSKMLIYRYFGSMDGLISAYLKRRDFWANLQVEVPAREQLGDYIKGMFHQQIVRMREDYALRKSGRWELTQENPNLTHLRELRESRGLEIVETVSRLSGHPRREVAALATLLAAAVTHLTILAENCPYYNGIPLRDDEGWRQLEEGIGLLIDLWTGTKP